jgi:catechol 2,3-dioxygenase-like lactoylglutathione lyase family enzyme
MSFLERAVKTNTTNQTVLAAFAHKAFSAAVLCACVAPLRAEPVPESERTPVDIRRTTFVVRDIDKSLPFYRDALGLKVLYDQLIGGGVDKDGKATAPSVRLVLLRANDTFIGALGLMQRLKPSATPVPEPVFAKAGPGQMIMVINVADLEQRWPRIESTPHIKVETKPMRIDYPSPGGGVIPVMFSAVWDPDGNYIELNRLMGAPAGAPVAAASAASVPK